MGAYGLSSLHAYFFFWSNGVDGCMLMRGRLLVDGLYVLLPAASVASGKKGAGLFHCLFWPICWRFSIERCVLLSGGLLIVGVFGSLGLLFGGITSTDVSC